MPSNFLDDWCQWVAAPPIDPIASPVAFERKCLGQDSVLSRGIGAYNSKFLFSDEYVFGNAQIANCCVHTPVGPTGATDGLTHVFPAVLDLQGPSKVDAIRYIASVVNALLEPDCQGNALSEAVGPMLDGNGGKIPRQEVPSLPGMDDIRGPWYLHLYDIQVASCEFSRWLRGGGTQIDLLLKCGPSLRGRQMCPDARRNKMQALR